MAHDPFDHPPHVHDLTDDRVWVPIAFWGIWTLAVSTTAAWVAWPALWTEAPLDTLRLVILSALVGVAGLLALTILELRLAPWHFLD